MPISGPTQIKVFAPVTAPFSFSTILTRWLRLIVGELAPVRAACHCREPVERIPFKRPRAVAGQIPIRVVNKSFAAAAADNHIVLIRRGIAVHIRRRYRDRGFSFKAVIAPG